MITALFHYKCDNKVLVKKGKMVTLNLRRTDKVREIFRTSKFHDWFENCVNHSFAAVRWTVIPGTYGLVDKGKSVLVMVANDDGDEYESPDSPIGCDEVIVVISTWSPIEGDPNEEFAAVRRAVKRLKVRS